VPRTGRDDRTDRAKSASGKALSCSVAKGDAGSVETRRLRDIFLEPSHRLVDGLGFAAGSCQARAQAVEQNGSPFLTAISGRSLPQ
jgi:hypothetical protein